APRVLLLATEAREAAPLAGALRAQSMDVVLTVGPAAISAAVQAGNLARADLVVLCDVSRGGAGEGKMLAALEAYVRDGGGLLVTGGPRSFGPGGWGGSRLEALLPVRLDTPQQRDEPTLALALVIDRSGSMSGAKMDLTKQAARGTAEMLPVDDQIAVIAFDSKATTIVPLQRAANRLRIATDIGRIQPTGGTNILAGLREAVDQLASARAKKKHVILLSDGQSATEGISELVDAAVGSGITISTIGVGDGVDDALMQLIAHQGGGRYYRTRDPASIPRIFTRENSQVAASSGVVERPTAALPKKRATVIEGIPWAAAPRLGGYVRTHPRGQAELLLATDGGDPLLTRWSVGLGQVVAWTSDGGVRWADAWTRWPPFAQLWGQIARGAMRARAARQFPLSARVQAGMVEVAVEAAGGANDALLSGLEGAVEVVQVAADGQVMQERTRRVPLAETAPGRYQAHFFVGDEVTTGRGVGALLLRGVLARQGQPVAEAVGQVSLPLVPELRPVSTAGSLTNGGDGGDGGGGGGGGLRGRALLEAIATATGGHALTTPADLFRGAERRRRRSRPLHAPLLGAVALLFVADVAVRRFAQRWPAPVGTVSEGRGTSPPPPGRGRR
ncbi:MAG: VWA domain-containing protein, partial [Myxococcales bacterium]